MPAEYQDLSASAPMRGPARSGFVIRQGALTDALLVLGTLGAAIAFGGARPILYLALALMALGGPAHAIRALSLGWLVTMVNLGLAGEAGGGALRNLFLLTAFASVTVSATMLRQGRMPVTIALLIWFVVYLGLSGAVLALAPDVAILKALLFGIGAVTVIWAYWLVEDPGRLTRWFRSLTVTLVLAGLPLALLPAGFEANDRGFQGLLGHPQAYGAFLGVALAWLAARWFFQRDRSAILTLTLLAGLGSLLATEARIGALSFAGAMLVTAISQFRERRHRDRVILALMVSAVLGGLVLAASPGARSELRDFVFKRAEVQDVSGAFQRSRGFLLARSLGNISEAPVFGIGFGMPSVPALLQVTYDPLLGLPTGASIEKGFAFVALVEETGMVGTLLFAVFFLSLARPIFRARDPGAIALFSAVILSNFGEATFFSFGGNGLITWLFLGLAMATARRAYG